MLSRRKRRAGPHRGVRLSGDAAAGVEGPRRASGQPKPYGWQRSRGGAGARSRREGDVMPALVTAVLEAIVIFLFLSGAACFAIMVQGTLVLRRLARQSPREDKLTLLK